MNLHEFCQWFEDHFECLAGPPMAYFELDVPASEEYPLGVKRYVYTMYWVVTKTGTESALLEHVLEPFKELLERRPELEKRRLWWRRRPYLLSSSDGLEVNMRLVIDGFGGEFVGIKGREGMGPELFK